MDAEIINNVLRALIGQTSAEGETNHDEKALENLGSLEIVLISILDTFLGNIDYLERHEASIKKISDFSKEVIKQAIEYCKDRLDNEY